MRKAIGAEVTLQYPDEEPEVQLFAFGEYDEETDTNSSAFHDEQIFMYCDDESQIMDMWGEFEILSYEVIYDS